MKIRQLLLALAATLLVSSCETFFPSEPTTKTTRVNPDGSTTITEVPYVDPQRAAHAKATLNLFAE